MLKFLDWAGFENPDKLLEQRFKDLRSDDILTRRKIEETVGAYYNHLIENGHGYLSARTEIGAIQSFFRHNYARLELDLPMEARHKKREHRMTKEDVVALIDVAGRVFERFLVAGLFQSLLRAGHFGEIRYGWIKRDLEEARIPLFIDAPPDLRTGRRKRFGLAFLGRDAVFLLRQYLESKFGKEFSQNPELTDETLICPVTPERINQILSKLTEKAGIAKPEEVSAKCLRKAGKNALDEAGISKDWVMLVMGHKIPGAPGFYTNPPVEKLREAYARAEPFLAVLRREPEDRVATLEQKLAEAESTISALRRGLDDSVLNRTRLREEIAEQKKDIADLRGRLETLKKGTVAKALKKGIEHVKQLEAEVKHMRAWLKQVRSESEHVKAEVKRAMDEATRFTETMRLMLQEDRGKEWHAELEQRLLGELVRWLSSSTDQEIKELLTRIAKPVRSTGAR